MRQLMHVDFSVKFYPQKLWIFFFLTVTLSARSLMLKNAQFVNFALSSNSQTYTLFSRTLQAQNKSQGIQSQYGNPAVADFFYMKGAASVAASATPRSATLFISSIILFYSVYAYQLTRCVVFTTLPFLCIRKLKCHRGLHVISGAVSKDTIGTE